MRPPGGSNSITRSHRPHLLRWLALALSAALAALVLPVLVGLAAGGPDSGYHSWSADSTTTDALGGATATWDGTPTYVTGHTGAPGDKAFDLAGARSLTVDNAAVGDFGRSDFAVHAWVRMDSLSNNQWIVSSRSPVCGIGTFFDLGFSSQQLVFEVDGGDNASYAAAFADASSIVDGSWHEVTAARSGRGISVQLDGGTPSYATSTAVADVTSSVSMALGRQTCNGSEALQGALDDVTVSAVDQHHVLGNGSIADDLSPAQTATQGSLTYTAGPTAGTVAPTFDGTSGFGFADPTVADLGTQDFVIDYAVRYDAPGGGGRELIAKRIGCNGFNALTVRGNDTSTEVELHDGSGMGVAFQPSFPSLADGAFHHFTLRRIGTTVTLALAGQTIGSATSPGVVNVANSDRLRFGYGACSDMGAAANAFHGAVADVTVATLHPLRITGPSVSMAQGSAVPTLTPLVAGMTHHTAITCSTTATSASAPGTYPVTCGTTDPTYSVTSAPGSVTVSAPALPSLTVTGPEVTATWGSTIPSSFTPTYSGLVNGDTAPSTVGTCTTTATSSSALGDYPITCSGFSDSGYAVTHTAGVLHLTAAPTVTVVAPNPTTTYGAALPTLTPTYTGLVNSDPAPSTAATCSTAATSTSAAGTYAVTCTGAADGHYAGFSYQAGSLTVTKAALTVAAPTTSVAFGASVPTSFTPTYSGLVAGDTAPSTVGTCTSTATSSSPAGSYPITCSGFSDPSYSVTHEAGTLTITAAGTVTVQAPSGTVVYGSSIGALTPTYAGLAGSATQTTTPATCTTAATAGSPAGAYAVTCSGAADSSYTSISYTTGTITITPHALTVTGPTTSRTYGSAVPALSPTYAGLVASDTAPATIGSCTTTATSSSPVGSYPVTCSGFADPSYTVTDAGGTYSVLPAGPLTVTAPTTTKEYGAPVPSLVPTYSGLAGGDTAPAHLPSCTTEVAAGSHVGTYAVSCGGATDTNYSAVNDVPGSVVVTPADLSVRTADVTVQAGAGVPALAPSYAGLLAGDTATDTVGTCTTTATASSSPGSYPISCSGFADTDYVIDYPPAALTITPAGTVTVTAPSSAKAYGDAVPLLRPAYSGLLDGATAPATEATCATTATRRSHVGSFAVTCDGAADEQYDGFSYVDGVLVVTPAPLLVQAPDATIEAGADVPASFEAAFQGLVAGDTAPATVGRCTTTATATSEPGDYPITCQGFSDTDYVITTAAGTLTLTGATVPTPSAPVTATAGPASTSPTASPTVSPTASPTASGTAEPTAEPTAGPTGSSAGGPVVDPGTGAVRELPPGSAYALLDGQATDATLGQQGPALRVVSGPVALLVSSHGRDGSTHSPSGATLTVDRGGQVEVDGTGFVPGTEIEAWLMSTPLRLGSSTVAADGTVHAALLVPRSVAGGHHTLQVNGRAADGLRSVSIGVVVDRTGLPLWKAVDNPEAVAATEVALLAVVGVTAISSAAAGGFTGGSAGGLAGGASARAGAAAGPAASRRSAQEESKRKSGKIASGKITKLAKALDGESRGDRSRSWRLPGTRWLDAVSREVPIRVAPRSPLLARLLADGVHVRAMVGALWALLVLAGAVVGAVAGLRTGAMPAPELALAGVALVLGAVDGFAGLAAGLAFLATVLLTGQLHSADEVRGALGVAAMWSALPLLVVDLRPLRRAAALTLTDAWYRVGDYLVLPLLAWWLVFKLVNAMPGLFGHVVPLSADPHALAWVGAGAVLLRLLLEELAAWLYPSRLAAVSPGKLPFSSRLQRHLGIAFRTAMLLFVAAPFIGLRWELWVGAGLIAATQVLKTWEDKLPTARVLERVVPRGAIKITLMVAIGWAVVTWLTHRVGGADLGAAGFVCMAVPPLLLGVVSVLGRDGEPPQPSWRHRGVGAVVAPVCLWLVYALTVAAA